MAETKDSLYHILVGPFRASSSIATVQDVAIHAYSAVIPSDLI